MHTALPRTPLLAHPTGFLLITHVCCSRMCAAHPEAFNTVVRRQERAPHGKVPPPRACDCGHEQRAAGEKLHGAVCGLPDAHRQADWDAKRDSGAGAEPTEAEF